MGRDGQGGLWIGGRVMKTEEPAYMQRPRSSLSGISQSSGCTYFCPINGSVHLTIRVHEANLNTANISSLGTDEVGKGHRLFWIAGKSKYYLLDDRCFTSLYLLLPLLDATRFPVCTRTSQEVQLPCLHNRPFTNFLEHDHDIYKQPRVRFCL